MVWDDSRRAEWDEGEKREEMLRFFRTAFRMKTLAEWRAELGRKEICFGPVNTLEETFAEQLRHRGMVVGQGGSAMPGPPIKLSDTRASIRTSPARFGEHTEEVLRGLGLGAAEVARLRGEGVV